MTAHLRTVVDGEEWKIVSYESAKGALCAGVAWPGEGQAMSCDEKADWFADGPVYREVGTRQAPGELLTWENAVINGVVDTDAVSRLGLVMTDCSTVALPIDNEGFFLGVVAASDMASGVWPHVLVAYGNDGSVVEELSVAVQAPDTEEAKQAKIEAADSEDCLLVSTT